VELCLRLGLATVYRRNSKISPSSRDREKYRKLLESQALAVQKLDPLNWPNCLALADLIDDYALKAGVSREFAPIKSVTCLYMSPIAGIICLWTFYLVHASLIFTSWIGSVMMHSLVPSRLGIQDSDTARS